jgi:hypothetical protein
MAVVVCPGPGPRRPACPVLSGGTCPLVEGADAIVIALRPQAEQMHELNRLHQARGLTVLAETSTSRAPGEEQGPTLTPAMSDETVVDVVLDALASRAKGSNISSA